MKSLAISVKFRESVIDLWACNIANEFKRPANIVERIHVLILLAVENDLSAVAVVAGFTKISLQRVTVLGTNDNWKFESVFIFFRMSLKHSGFSSLKIVRSVSISVAKCIMSISPL